MQPPNPNGFNEFLLDPRQNLCWGFYINPKSETFGKITKSGIKAGYVPEYAEQLGTSAWFLAKLRRLNMLNKAEKVLDEMLELEAIDPGDKKLRQDTAKFVAERLGKSEGYSTRSELTGKDGADLLPKPILDLPNVQPNISNQEDTKPVQED